MGTTAMPLGHFRTVTRQQCCTHKRKITRPVHLGTPVFSKQMNLWNPPQTPWCPIRLGRWVHISTFPVRPWQSDQLCLISSKEIWTQPSRRGQQHSFSVMGIHPATNKAPLTLLLRSPSVHPIYEIIRNWQQGDTDGSWNYEIVMTHSCFGLRDFPRWNIVLHDPISLP